MNLIECACESSSFSVKILKKSVQLCVSDCLFSCCEGVLKFWNVFLICLTFINLALGVCGLRVFAILELEASPYIIEYGVTLQYFHRVYSKFFSNFKRVVFYFFCMNWRTKMSLRICEFVNARLFQVKICWVKQPHLLCTCWEEVLRIDSTMANV